MSNKSFPKSISDLNELNNGVKMPWLGLGVWQINDGAEVEKIVNFAVENGYRSIDTAAIYRNEKGVGAAVKKCDVPREDLFITSKVWNSNQGYEATLKAFSESLRKLQTDYLDLYLIHWPVSNKFNDTWKALEKLYEEKLVRVIGVSNFMMPHLEKLFATANIIPAVNQVEFHPFLTQPELIEYCKKHLIQVEAWSPLMQGNFLNINEIIMLAEKYNKTPAQILLRWDLQNEVVTIPKTENYNRIVENSKIFDFNLTDDDVELLNSLNKNYRYGPDPNNFNF